MKKKYRFRKILVIALAMCMMFSTSTATFAAKPTTSGSSSNKNKKPGKPSKPAPENPTPSEPTPSEPAPENPTPSEPTPSTPAPVTKTQAELYDMVMAKVKTDIPKYDYMTSNLSSALTNHKGNCMAIALYIKVACDSLNIPCDIIMGTNDLSSYGDMHIVNRVILDGKAYWSDMSTTILGYGSSYAKSTTALYNISRFKYYYEINPTAGTYTQLEALALNYKYKSVTAKCNYASMIAMTAKSDYSRNYSVIANKFK